MPGLFSVLGSLPIGGIVDVLLTINMDIHLVILVIIVDLLVYCIVLKLHRCTSLLFVSQ